MSDQTFTDTPVKHGGGPHGLGDPNDRSLRIVEKEVLIPKLIREVAKTEKCFPEVEAFNRCCQDSKLLMAFQCREVNEQLKTCLAGWYQNEEFKEECKERYLKQRAEYRTTGISTKKKKAIEEARQHLAERQ